METTGLLLAGILTMAGGIFAAVYGNALFRFALAAIGFVAGLAIGVLLLRSASPAILVMGSLGLGAVGAIVFYMLFSVGLYLAGVVLGVVVAMSLLALLGMDSTITTIGFLVAGAVGGGVLAAFIRDWIVMIAMSFAGAFGVLYGYNLIFPGIVGSVDPVRVPNSFASLVLLLVLAVMAFLSQFQARNIRQRR